MWLLLRICIHSVHFVSLPAAVMFENRGCFRSTPCPSFPSSFPLSSLPLCGSQPLNPAIMLSALSSHSRSGCFFWLKTMPLVRKSTCLHLSKLKTEFWIYIVLCKLMTIWLNSACPTITGHALGRLGQIFGWWSLVGHQDTSGSPHYVHCTDFLAIQNVPVK